MTAPEDFEGIGVSGVPDPEGHGDAVPAPEDAAPTGVEPPSLRAVGVWLVLAGIAIAIDGAVGGVALVVIAAVVLAGISTRVLGLLGVLALLGVPVAVILGGLPSGEDLSPAFVYQSLVPHHLTFFGLILVSAGALFDMAPHLHEWATGERPPQSDGPPLGPVLGVVVVAIVAAAAWMACAAVLGA